MGCVRGVPLPLDEGRGLGGGMLPLQKIGNFLNENGVFWSFWNAVLKANFVQEKASKLLLVTRVSL